MSDCTYLQTAVLPLSSSVRDRTERAASAWLPQALISRMAALVPPPKRHMTVYSGVLASNNQWRMLIIPKTEAMKENEVS
jgi:hypothetical protein